MNNETDFNKIHETLTIQVEKYIKAILDEYGRYIPPERKVELNNIKDFNSVIKIHDYGSINGYASYEGISMPMSADNVLKKMSKIPGFGTNKNHRSYDETNLITNNNTFMDYVKHVFISGTTTQEYYEDLLLHETMHFCGSGGAFAIKEGINELLTRKIALKRNFKTSGCGYPKEVAIAYKLQEILGEDIINQIAFIPYQRDVLKYLESTLGKEYEQLYEGVTMLMEYEFQDKYYRFMNSYNDTDGMLEKIKNYEKIDYEKVDLFIKEFEEKNIPSNKFHR